MSNPLKKLAGQTVIYGLSSILPRFLNYLLTPLLTYIFRRPVDFGINAEFYAYISFMNIIFTYGMETAFFHFSAKTEDKTRVYSTALISLIASTLGLSLLLFLFSGKIANWMDYPDHLNYIIWCILIIGTDAIMAIPFARLRQLNRAKRFALIKCMNVLVNISLNVFFFVICKNAYEAGEESLYASLYKPEVGIGYSFMANLIANVVSLLLLTKEFRGFDYVFDKELWKKMFGYAWPLLLLGLAGMVNETFDRIVLKYLLPEQEGKYALGVYSACYKIAILMTIFIQAFKYAAEPFFFNHAKEQDSKRMNALVMKYFTIFCSTLFLGTMMNMDWIKYFVSGEYRTGLSVVPILLLANLFLGVYYNLSIWFKLTGQTRIGAGITIVGAAITLFVNFTFIPKYGYMACAWGTLAAYGTMMIVSYIVGQRYYPIKYNLRSIFFFFFAAMFLYLISRLYSGMENKMLRLFLNNALLVIYLWLFYKLELPRLKKLKSSTS